MDSRNAIVMQDAPAHRLRPTGADRPRRGIPRLLLSSIVFVSVLAGELLVWLACRLSWNGAFRLALWISRRVEPLTRRRRQANLHLFFRSSGRTEAQLQEFDEAHLCYLARMRAEVARCVTRTPADLSQSVIFEGADHLRHVLERKRGVLLVSGHTATWWFAPAALAARGYPVTAIFTPIKFRKVERKLLRLADRFGVRIAFVGRDAYKAAQRAIERNEILYLTFDVAVRERRARHFRFGDAWLQIDPGPAILAARNAMPTLQAACTHSQRGRNQVSLYPPEAAELVPQTAAAPGLCRLWLQRLEEEVRAHPEQWWPWGYVDLRERPSEPPFTAEARKDGNPAFPGSNRDE